MMKQVEYHKKLTPTNGMNLLKKLRVKNDSIFYYVMLFLTISGLVFIVSSRKLFGDDSPIIDAGIGNMSVKSVGTTDVSIVEKKVNPKTGYGEIILRVEEPVTQVGIKYEAVVGENATKQLVQSKLTRIYDQYYLIQLTNIPSKWKQLVVDFGYTTREKPQLNTNYLTDNIEDVLKKKSKKTEQATYIFDYRKMDKVKELRATSQDENIVKVTSIELENVENLIDKATENKQAFTKEIGLLQEKIEELNEEKEYQTKEQIKKTDNAIMRVKSEIETYQKSIKDIDKQTDSLTEKKQKLIERNRKSAQK